MTTTFVTTFYVPAEYNEILLRRERRERTTWDNFCGDLGIFRERVAQLGNQAPKRRMERLALIQRTESFRASGMDGF